MHWQDVVFTGGSVVFCVTLIPMLRAAHKPPLHTSAPIAAMLFVFAVTYLSLGFVLAPLIEFFQGSLWAGLAIQGARLASRRGEPLADSAVDLGSSPSAST